MTCLACDDSHQGSDTCVKKDRGSSGRNRARDSPNTNHSHPGQNTSVTNHVPKGRKSSSTNNNHEGQQHSSTNHTNKGHDTPTTNHAHQDRAIPPTDHVSKGRDISKANSAHRGTNTSKTTNSADQDTSKTNQSHQGRKSPRTASHPLYNPNQKAICFKGSGCVFSNMYPCDIVYQGKKFPSSEGAYQWQKAMDLGQESIAHEIFLCENGFAAKSEAGRLEHLDSAAVEQWRKTKGIEAMKRVQETKFEYVAEFRKTLMDSYRCCLVEATPDMFWGAGLSEAEALKCESGSYPGQNNLGVILMELRTKYFPHCRRPKKFSDAENELSDKRSQSTNDISDSQRSLSANEVSQRSPGTDITDTPGPMQQDATMKSREVKDFQHKSNHAHPRNEKNRHPSSESHMREQATLPESSIDTTKNQYSWSGNVAREKEMVIEKVRDLRDKVNYAHARNERNRHSSIESDRREHAALPKSRTDTTQEGYGWQGNLQMAYPSLPSHYQAPQYARLENRNNNARLV